MTHCELRRAVRRRIWGEQHGACAACHMPIPWEQTAMPRGIVGVICVRCSRKRITGLSPLPIEDAPMHEHEERA